METEASAKIRLALKRRIRCKGEDWGAGDIVYYKRNKDGRWKGPAKVLARNGQILHLGHGNTTIKTHESRVVRKDEELIADSNKENG